MSLTRIACLIGVLALSGCGGGGGGGGTPASVTPPSVAPPTAPPPAANPSTPPAPPSPVLVEGAVQKGPFIVGSTVLVNLLDDRGRSTTSTLLAEIEDSIGSFSFETDQRGAVQIVATGYYFNELTGQISDGVLALKALYEVGDDSRQTAHVNILTHLINDRVLELIADGEPSLNEAIEQAEDELVAALLDALPIPDLNEFTALSVYDSVASQGNTLGNAYLLALSTGFYRYAENKASEFHTATDAELTLILNRLADDLADDGHLEPGPFIEEFVTAIRSLSPEMIAANLRSRSLVDYPQGLGVPDISVFLRLCAGNFDCPWSAAAAMPYRSAMHATAVHDGKIYVIGGGQMEPVALNPMKLAYQAHVYDPLANTWAPIKSLPEESFGAHAHPIGDTIYVVMGSAAGYQNGTYVNDEFSNGLYAYDPVANEWSAKAHRPTHRNVFATAVVNGLIYVIGGRGAVGDGPGVQYSGPRELKSHVEIYDPTTDSWSAGAPMPFGLEPRNQACVVSDEIYIFGGESLATDFDTSILVYDTTSNSWSAKAPMRNGRVDFACVVVDGAAYLLGGRDASNKDVDIVERYDPFVETWSNPTRLPSSRFHVSAEVIGQKVFTIGGTRKKPSAPWSETLDVVEVLDVGSL
jgi:N-acetylneuraminic acid mutarotase